MSRKVELTEDSVGTWGNQVTNLEVSILAPNETDKRLYLEDMDKLSLETKDSDWLEDPLLMASNPSSSSVPETPIVKLHGSEIGTKLSGMPPGYDKWCADKIEEEAIEETGLGRDQQANTSSPDAKLEDETHTSPPKLFPKPIKTASYLHPNKGTKGKTQQQEKSVLAYKVQYKDVQSKVERAQRESKMGITVAPHYKPPENFGDIIKGDDGENGGLRDDMRQMWIQDMWSNLEDPPDGLKIDHYVAMLPKTISNAEFRHHMRVASANLQMARHRSGLEKVPLKDLIEKGPNSNELMLTDIAATITRATNQLCSVMSQVSSAQSATNENLSVSETQVIAAIKHLKAVTTDFTQTVGNRVEQLMNFTEQHTGMSDVQIGSLASVKPKSSVPTASSTSSKISSIRTQSDKPSIDPKIEAGIFD
jgi:hypothetical protein